MYFVPHTIIKHKCHRFILRGIDVALDKVYNPKEQPAWAPSLLDHSQILLISPSQLPLSDLPSLSQIFYKMGAGGDGTEHSGWVVDSVFLS